jgi:hypothetical protein
LQRSPRGGKGEEEADEEEEVGNDRDRRKKRGSEPTNKWRTHTQ